MGLKLPVHSLLFDLDDTLFDTYGQLVEPASREACKAMVEKGLNATTEECFSERRKIFISAPRLNVYTELVRRFGIKPGADPVAVENAGTSAFYDRKITEDLRPFPDTHSTLEALSSRYTLILVTLGMLRTQQKKVDLLKLERHFRQIHCVDFAKGDKKKQIFEKILKESGARPETFVSIGNRIDSEIRDAKELGMQTVLMDHGEYTHLKPENPAEIPDGKILHLKELLNLLSETRQ